jgi:integrase
MSDPEHRRSCNSQLERGTPPSGPKYKAAFATAYGAGLRVSEVVALQGSVASPTIASCRISLVWILTRFPLKPNCAGSLPDPYYAAPQQGEQRWQREPYRGHLERLLPSR